MRKGSSKEWPLIDAFGICRQTVLPLYLRPSIDSALVTQLLFGECYQLRGLTSDRQWFQAFHEDTGVEGWVWANSIKEITAADYQVFLNQDFQIVTSPIAAISYQGASVYLLPGSRLHFSEKELFNWQDHVGFTGTVRPHAQKASREELVDLALRFLHAPFQSGGRSIFGLDEVHAFPLIFGMGGYSWVSGKLPGKQIEPEEMLPGDVLVASDPLSKKSFLGLFLGADELLWMDHRVGITDLYHWESHIKKSSGAQLEIDMYTLLA
ncbi:MAG: SH3 domain-containing protein [Cyclobacteriaceae bacterium]|nr:SH3 domain-containing protein [Cyclobacteriaceae bacterium]